MVGSESKLRAFRDDDVFEPFHFDADIEIFKTSGAEFRSDEPSCQKGVDEVEMEYPFERPDDETGKFLAELLFGYGSDADCQVWSIFHIIWLSEYANITISENNPVFLHFTA